MSHETEGDHPDPLEALDDDELDLEEIDLGELGDDEEADNDGPPSDE